jgi:hypothetical protein
MDASNLEHDRWMEKITHALRSFRSASQRKADQAEGRTGSADAGGEGATRERT